MKNLNRRSFLKTSLGAAAATPLAGMAWKPFAGRGGSLEVLRVASVGVGGMGWSDIRQVASHPAVEIAAICDVDSNNLKRAAELFADAKGYSDWRLMFADKSDDFDAVIVSTPDHMHAPIAMTALMTNKSVYCQKPLTHTIYESRRLREVAARKPILATQMGTQNASRSTKRQAFQMLKDGIVGKVVSIHAWSDRPAGWWPQGKDRPAGNDPVPEYLEWDLWIGIAQPRPYVNDTYAPFKWRGFRPFGCGALGDMACHISDTPLQAFGLYTPTSVVVQATDATNDMFPTTEGIQVEFEGVDASDGNPVTYHWTDGGRIPKPSELKIRSDYSLQQNCVAIVGSEKTLLIDINGSPPQVFTGGDPIEVQLPNLKARNHWHHWVDAALGGEPTQSNFGFAGRMCEMLALGALASRYPNQKLAYDSKLMRFPDFPEANQWVKTTYRSGWEAEGLS